MKARSLKLPLGAKIAAAMLLSAVGGGAVVATFFAPNSPAEYRQAASALSPVATAEAMPVIPKQVEPVRAPHQEDESATQIQLTDRERQVLARLASLPDLPVVRAPAFDVKVQNAPSAPATAGKIASATAPGAAKTAETPPPAPAGESVIARIQVVSVEKGRVFYRSVDDVMHTARAGERLLGVNGRVIAVDEHGAELQIDGQRMRVAANNM
jgi:hypothetical protein